MNADRKLVRQLLVAVPAAVGHRQPESRRARADGVVLLVTVGAAGRAFRVASRRGLQRGLAKAVAAAMDAGLQPLLDKPMASSAGVGNPGGVQQGLLVFGRQNSVCAVAIGTDRCHQQARRLQPLAMNAFQIGLLRRLVALAAAFHLVVDKHRRVTVLDRRQAVDVLAVAGVAVEHRADPLFVFRAGLAVDVGQHQIPLLRVTGSAHVDQLGGVGEGFRIRRRRASYGADGTSCR